MRQVGSGVNDEPRTVTDCDSPGATSSTSTHSFVVPPRSTSTVYERSRELRFSTTTSATVSPTVVVDALLDACVDRTRVVEAVDRPHDDDGEHDADDGEQDAAGARDDAGDGEAAPPGLARPGERRDRQRQPDDGGDQAEHGDERHPGDDDGEDPAHHPGDRQPVAPAALRRRRVRAERVDGAAATCRDVGRPPAVVVEAVLESPCRVGIPPAHEPHCRRSLEPWSWF